MDKKRLAKDRDKFDAAFAKQLEGVSDADLEALLNHMRQKHPPATGATETHHATEKPEKKD